MIIDSEALLRGGKINQKLKLTVQTQERGSDTIKVEPAKLNIIREGGRIAFYRGNIFLKDYKQEKIEEVHWGPSKE
jgi:hypothetical protein